MQTFCHTEAAACDLSRGLPCQVIEPPSAFAIDACLTRLPLSALRDTCAQRRRPVTCVEDIRARVQEFQHVLPQLPLPPASHTE